MSKKSKIQNSMTETDFPTSVIQVETAIPAFIGYTEKGSKKPTMISSMNDYRNLFGGPSHDEIGKFEIEKDGKVISSKRLNSPKYKMYYMLEMFFANGGEDCFIISSGHYNSASVKNSEMLSGLKLLAKEDLPTLILFPDATSFRNLGNPTRLYKAALTQCAKRKDRFLICDVEEVDNSIPKSAEVFRNSLGDENLSFGAAYFPSLQTILKYNYSEDKIQVILKTNSLSTHSKKRTMVLRHTDKTITNESNKVEESLYHAEKGKYKIQYQEIKNTIESMDLELPPSAAIAGVYAQTDKNRGVWKAPANVSLNYAKDPTISINDTHQEDLNVSSSGKSINAIRKFIGKGVMVWGARTLAGNDNERRYISVNRLRMMIEKSLKNTTEHFRNQPNEPETWFKVRALIENYLSQLWREGALQGSKPEEAFYVLVGYRQTMTEQDMRDGKMIVEIGIATVRPAEFIIIKFIQKMNSK